MKPSSLLFPTPTQDVSSINALCIGSGRFLRSVLVPALIHCQLKPIILQTRGRTFMDYVSNRSNISQESSITFTYEVDTVHYDGKIQTEIIPFYGVGTLGTDEGKQDLLNLVSKVKVLSFIGVGVTEAGLSSADSKTMQDLADILEGCCISQIACNNPNGKICVVCTDNIPNSGDLLRSYMVQIAKSREEEKKMDQANNDVSERLNKKQRVDNMSFLQFLYQKVTFHNTMVDRITSQRDGSNGMVPRAEPIPSKALVIEDLNGDLPKAFLKDETRSKYGVVVRTRPGQLRGDIALKLRVANGTHTSIAHLMALSQLLMTDTLSSKSEESKLIMAFLDSFFEGQILPAAEKEFGLKETKAVYEDWRKRLIHGHFGLSTLFITQNGAAKGGIRIGPTVRDLVAQNKV
jgi:mannitol-1-phosphate/altronate dehydrogenase